MKKILVTGAAGYIGRHVVEQLLKDNMQVIAADIDLSCFGDEVVKKEISIFDCGDDVYEQMGRPDVCLHLAWLDGFAHGSHRHLGMLSAHYEFIDNMLKGGLPQIAVMGSMHEIGYYEGEINDDTPADPISNYGIAKNALRTATLRLCEEYGAIYQWLRGYYITGDDANNHSIFAKLIAAENEGKPEFPFTSGTNKYDFIDINDLAYMIASTIEQSEVTGIINCCSGKPVSLGEKVEGFIRERGYGIRLKYGAFPDRKYDSPAIWGNTDRISRILAIRKNNT